MTEPHADRWRAHPVLGAMVRILVVLVPLAVSVAVSFAVIALLPTPTTSLGKVAWWTVVLVVAWVAALLVDRVARRALPLAVLLELSLVFPDRAPSRLRTVRGTSVRELEKQLASLRSVGAEGTPLEVAETLVSLVGVLGAHDPKTRGHSERVRAYVDLLSEEMQLPDEDRVRLRWAALIHDLGKLTVPSEVLNGGRDLPAEAWVQLHAHPDEGHRLAAGLLPWLGEWGQSVRQHHEWWDGSGYPQGLKGEEICQGARIVAVADAFEVMTAHRSYSRARSAPAAREELSRCAGTQFDPAVVRAFLQISLGRLRWVLGPLSSLSVLPFAAGRAGDLLRAGAGAAAVVSGVVAGVVPGPSGDRPETVLTQPGSPAATTDPASQPSPFTLGSPGLSTATAAPSATTSAGPTGAPTGSPTAVATRSAPTTPPRSAPRLRSYYLVPAGLSARRPAGGSPATAQLFPGRQGKSFDLAVGSTPSTLSGRPVLLLYTQVANKTRTDGLGLLEVTLSDCSTATGPCAVLSTTLITVGADGRTSGYQPVTTTLSSTTGVLRPGHVLRMTVQLKIQGNASSVTLAFGAASTPSRLDLTAAPPP